MRILEIYLEKERKTFFKEKIRLILQFSKIIQMNYIKTNKVFYKFEYNLLQIVGYEGLGSVFEVNTEREISESRSKISI